jgi:hypothetical protein
MMIAVAVAGVSVASYMSLMRMGRVATAHRARGSLYAARAQGHRNDAASYSNQVETIAHRVAIRREDARSEYDLRKLGAEEESLKGLRDVVRWCDALADHYEALSRKYDSAARSPWLPVAPDPPEPE